MLACSSEQPQPKPQSLEQKLFSSPWLIKEKKRLTRTKQLSRLSFRFSKRVFSVIISERSFLVLSGFFHQLQRRNKNQFQSTLNLQTCFDSLRWFSRKLPKAYFKTNINFWRIAATRNRITESNSSPQNAHQWMTTINCKQQFLVHTPNDSNNAKSNIETEPTRGTWSETYSTQCVLNN